MTFAKEWDVKLSMRFATILLSTLCAGVTQAADYPKNTIHLVVPYSAGGGTDLMARLLSKELSELLDTSVVVDNRPGASGNIGTNAVARARPDGYTLLFTSSGHVINPSIFKELPFDPLNDFAAVAQIAQGPSVLVVNAQSEYESLSDLLQARDSKEELTFGSAGIGQPTHLAAESFASTTGLPVLHVPYSGSADAEVGLATGQVDFLIDSIPAAQPFINAQKTRALAVTSNSRFPTLPDVPTVSEEGVDDFAFTTWWGILAPAGTPSEHVEKLSQAIEKAMESTEIERRFIEMGAEPRVKSSVSFGEYVEQELSSYETLITDLNIKAH